MQSNSLVDSQPVERSSATSYPGSLPGYEVGSSDACKQALIRVHFAAVKN
jgi:hypothetical protein